jgi:hypothetical protein
VILYVIAIDQSEREAIQIFGVMWGLVTSHDRITQADKGKI